MSTKLIEEKLLKKNTNPTSMRILVYDYLSKQSVALSLAEIDDNFEHADRSTIYRTLKTFEEKGVIHSIQENNTTKYMLCSDECNAEHHKDWHLHFYCHICEQTTCREDIIVPKVEGDFIIEEIRFFAKGICEACRKKTLQ